MPNSCHTILIVEDDAPIRTTLKEALEFEGYVVATAENGQVAVDMLKSLDHPCLILLDLMMPIMNGWEFLDLRQTDDVLLTIPVAVVTASMDSGIKAARGVQTVIKKPIDLNKLLDWVKIYCGPSH